jgi:hypothetical protein
MMCATLSYANKEGSRVSFHQGHVRSDGWYMTMKHWHEGDASIGFTLDEMRMVLDMLETGYRIAREYEKTDECHKER